MPDYPHEAIVEAVQNEPELVAALLHAAGGRLPSGVRPVIADSNLSVRDPMLKKQYTADNVFAFEKEGGAKVVVVVEVQSEAPDRERNLAWPAYACVARSKHHCDVQFLAFGLTPDAVRGCRKTIVTGHPGLNLKPYVTGHGLLPAIRPDARFAPELALMHVVTKSIDMTSHDERMLVLTAIAKAPLERRDSYTRSVRAVVPESVGAELENIMKTVIKDKFMDGLIEQGKAEGEADGILRVLDARGIEVSPAERERITSCHDLEQLREWITRAAKADKTSDVFR